MGKTNSQNRWLELSEASKMLGVHFSTLRRWADAGKVAHTRTPGGRRRFAREEIEKLLGPTQPQPLPNSIETLYPQITALARTPRHIYSISSSVNNWMMGLDPMQRVYMRRTGQRMMALMMQYNSRVEGGEAFLEEAKRAGDELGLLCRQTGLSTQDTLRIFLLFQESILCAVYETGSIAGECSDDGSRMYRRTHRFLSEVMITLIAGHLEAAKEPTR